MNCPACGQVNPPHYRFCRACGAALGGAPAGESERRLATVLFADMSGFTAMSEQLDPEQVHEIINDFLRALAACVQRYGGTIDKYIGDAIMAVFGAPRMHEDDPERALATALEMREGLRAVNERRAAQLPQPAGLHIGVNTGLVIAGRVGDTSRSDYTVVGDAVNLASRLADIATSGQIVVSEHTYRATRHAFAFRELEPVRVKGKAEPVAVFELLGRRARRGSRRGVPGVTAPLVGRDAELARLTEAVDRLGHGAGGVVTVTGPAGAGKSRLLAEASATARARGVRWVEAACTSLGQSATLTVWADVLRRLLGFSDQTSRRAVTTRLTLSTRMLALDEARDASAVLAHLLRLNLTPKEHERLSGLDDEALRMRLFLAVRGLIEAEAARAPLVLVLDDLHWCDSASLRLLQFVMESTARVPVLLAAAFRSDAEVRGLLDEAIARVMPPFRVDIDLQPLSPTDSAALAEALVGTDPGLADVRSLLVEYAEGNPLFLEEVLRSLIDQGVLRYEDGAWQLSHERGSVILPETLQGLLLDRIDRLPEASKRLMQIAAVIGRTFPAALLGEISGVGAGIGPLLAGLEQAGFLERDAGPGETQYRFRHGLMQEAAYSSLLHRHRRDYHRRVAEWYERRIDAARPDPETAARLAHHWERAESWAQAGYWALRAADEARRSFALDEAADLYRRALQFAERAGDAAVRGAAEQGLGEAAFAAGSPEAVEHFSAALELAGRPLERAMLERRIGQAHHRDGRYNLALASFARAAAILGVARDEEAPEWQAERARLRVARAATHLQSGDDEPAQLAAESALHAELPASDRAEAAIVLGDVFLRRGDAARAAEYYDAALALARAAGNLVCAASVLEKLAEADLRRRQRDEALRALDECLTLRRRLGDRGGVAAALLRLARMDEHEGALLAAAERLREAIAHAAAADDPVLGAQAHLRLGRVLRALGNWANARAALERAGSDDPEAAGRAALELALLAVEQGAWPETELREGLDEGERQGIADLAADARLGLATLARRRRRFDEARAYLREVLVAQQDDSVRATLARIGLAELALDERRRDVAVSSAEMALAAAERTGPALAVWRARRKLGAALGLAGRYADAEEQLRAATDATRAAETYPELARCLADWAAVRTLAGSGTPDTKAQAMIAEMRDIWAFLAGRAPSGDDGSAAASPDVGRGERISPLAHG